HFIQEWRMQEVRNGPNIAEAVAADLSRFARRFPRFFRQITTRSHNYIEMHAQCGKVLPGAVVEFACDSSPFVILQTNQSLRKQAQGIFGYAMLGNIAKR